MKPLHELKLNDCPKEERPLLKAWRELTKQGEAWIVRDIEHYFAFRLNHFMDVGAFIETYIEDFDGDLLNRNYTKNELESLRRLFLQRCKILDAISRRHGTENTGSAYDRPKVYSTLGRILEALKLPEAFKPSPNPWDLL